MLSKGSVLVVDDEINLCRILGAKLAKNGYSVVAVHDGLQAVEKIREREFDLVLLDLILPKMDGLAALTEIRGMKQALPVIIMSACENSDAIDQAMQSGASAYIKKPFDLDSLVTLVQNTSKNNGCRNDHRPEDSTVLFVKGQPVILDVRDHNGFLSFNSRVEEKDDRTVSVIAPEFDEDIVDIPPKTPVRVGLAANDAYYSFNSFVIARKDNGKPLLVLDKPGAIYRTQRRQFPRRQIDAQAQYSHISRAGERAESLAHALTLDVSEGGMRLALDESLIPGQFIFVKVDSPHEIGSFSAIAQVMHCRENRDPDLPGFVAGLRFSQADEGVRKALANV